MTISYLVTHSGGFHADELLSSVVLTRLYPDAQIVRTRDEGWITPAEGRLIYDVGRDYDAARGVFDHHQQKNPLRPDGQPYSSFGLIWHHYGQDYLRSHGVPEADIAAIHDKMDQNCVLPIDLMDNGAVQPSVAGPLLSKLTLPVL
ncbi:MAG: MYG1 family protein, partial [Pseudomonadota bacterium]|nr:MYG1 family protein [Pseudomonadota bacterium]